MLGSGDPQLPIVTGHRADRPRGPEVLTEELLDALRTAGVTDLDASSRRLSEFSSDASNYRVRPRVVVRPRDADEVVAVLDVARRLRVPVTPRGGGTSIAGNAVGTGIVLDLTTHLASIGEIDPEARTARVQPGAVLGTLQARAARHGLRFGPDPSTWTRCTLGGMIGNNACGSHALAFGRTADNIESLEIVDGAGCRLTLGQGLHPVDGLEELVATSLTSIRTELGRFGRQISGYSLEHLLPERGRWLARAFAGSEGTWGVVVDTTLRLVPVPQAPQLVVLGFPDMPAAADAVPALLEHRPEAMEGLDSHLVDVIREHRGIGAVPELPAGAGWLLVEVADREPGDAQARAAAIVRSAGALAARVVEPGPEQQALWRIREDGGGLAGRSVKGRPAWPGFEDAAVPPEHLGAYLREFDALLAEHDIHGVPFGHFGDGCVHVRLDIPLDHDGRALAALMQDAAELVVRHGGSLSGEHGDGRARSSLLPLMYSPTMLDVFARAKALFDPDGILNPGVIVDPAPLDEDLRRPRAVAVPAADGFAFGHDHGDLTVAAHRCVGVAKCRADGRSSGTFMCPSFLATRDEKDSTRGRARVLQEVLSGTTRPQWNSPDLAESLDLCLSCKACSSDCPAGVDMAAMKSELLSRRYAGRLRPITHYSLGWLPRWARLAGRVGRLVNPLLSVRPLERALLRAGGMDPRRRAPRFAPEPFRRWRSRQRVDPPRATRQVALWIDTFTDNFDPDIARAAIRVLETAGYDVVVPDQSACCGLTWITTGQLAGARRRLVRLLDVLHPFVAAGMPIVGLEPSCTAVLRSDLGELVPGDPRATTLAANTHTLAELLSAPAPLGPDASWVDPDLSGVDLVVQPHCHHHSVMGFDTDRTLLRRWGARETTISGCCGLAGNFGMERGHYEVSVAVAENGLLPTLRAAPQGAVLLADGLSCRTQADQLADVQGIHLAQLIAAHLPQGAPPGAERNTP